MVPLVAVLRVVNVLPQVQVTWVSTYAGWMSFFMVSSRRAVAGSSCWCARREPEPRIYLASQRRVGANPSPPRRSGPGRRSVVAVGARGRLLDLHEELDVALGLLEPLDEQLERLLALEARQHPAQLPDDRQLLLAHEEVVAA